MFVILTIVVLVTPVLLYIAFKLILKKLRQPKGTFEVEAAYKRTLERHQLTILEVNRFSDRLIAIDRNNGKLVVVLYKNGITWERCVDLEEVSSCQVIKATNHENGYTEKVSMELTLCHSDEIIRFPFFDNAIDDVRDLVEQTKKSQYWKQKINYYIDFSKKGFSQVRGSNGIYPTFL